MDGNFDGHMHANAKAKASIGCPASRQDKHERPVSPSEDSEESLFIRMAWLGTIPRMRMDPHSAEAMRSQASVDLFIKVVRHPIVVETNRPCGTGLPDQAPIGNIERLIGGRDPEAADFRFSEVTQIQKLGPSRRTKPKYWNLRC